jgi:quinol monooxygenase YgiN
MARPGLFIVVGEFTVDPSDRDRIVDALLANRRDTLASEPGCRTYEVCVPEEGDNRIFMVEIYDSRAAFEAHKTTPHFKRWHVDAAHLIKTEKATFLNRLLP